MRRYRHVAFGREPQGFERAWRYLFSLSHAACRRKGLADRPPRARRGQRTVAQREILLVIAFNLDRRQSLEQVLSGLVGERLGRRSGDLLLRWPLRLVLSLAQTEDQPLAVNRGSGGFDGGASSLTACVGFDGEGQKQKRHAQKDDQSRWVIFEVNNCRFHWPRVLSSASS